MLCVIKNRVDKAKIVSILATVAITFTAWALCGNFTRWIADYLTSIFKPMSSWALAYPIFAISIGHIPWTSYLFWKRNPKAKYLTLISYSIIAWCLMVLTVILAFVLADHLVKPDSPFLPENIVWLPFPDYWNVVLPFASVIGLGVLSLVRKKTGNRASKSRMEVIDSSE